MNRLVKGYVLKLSKISAIALCCVLLPGVWAGFDYLFATGLAYVLSYVFVVSNFVAIGKIDMRDHKKFYRIFLISLVLRFAFMIVALILVLQVIKIHQIFFTVSFIISYIFHSVIEIIFINKILETDS